VRASSRLGGSSKTAQILEDGNGSLEWGARMGGDRKSKVSTGSAPNPSHGTKILGKMLPAKKAHKKNFTSETKFNDRHEPPG
jgi:hypothetical protein